MSYTALGDAFALPPNLNYRGEGNSSIVVSLPDTREILRLHKRFRPRSLIGWIVTFLRKLFVWNAKHDVDRETQNLRFYLRVMRGLLGARFVGEARRVQLSRRQVGCLNEYLANLRPAHRKEKCIQSGRATIFEDYAFLPKHIPLKSPVYAVEIKPKQGFIPRLQKRFDKCTYCLNQYLKLQNGQIDRVSRYCPFDLFSGNKERMYKAISALVENPQNNLRIFQNGVLVYGENKPPTAFHETMQNWLQLNAKPQVYLEKFCRLLSLALLTNFPANRADHVCAGDQTDPNPETAFSASCSEVTGENLPKDCVLKQIFALQQLDAMGPQGYAKGAESSDLELWKYIDHLLEEVNEHTHKCPKCVVGGILRRNGKARAQSEKDRCLFFVPYLLACVARDCSIMLSFGKVQDDDLRIGAASEGVQTVTVDSTKFVIKVGIIDLYPKPMSSILKHCKRAEAMHQAYRSVVQS